SGLVAGVKDAWILGMRGNVPSFAAAGAVEPVAGLRSGVTQIQCPAAGHAERSIVLLRATDVIGEVRRCGYVVHLRRGIALRRPSVRAVGTDTPATIVATDHP